MRGIIFFILTIISISSTATELIVPYGSGGSVDTIARHLSDILTKNDFTNVVVNKPGASGNIGLDYFTKCKSSCLVIAGDNVINNKKLYPVSFPDRFISVAKPIIIIGRTHNILVARSSLDANSLSELVIYNKTKTLNFGHGGIGTISHKAQQLFCSKILRCQDISYKSSSTALIDLYGQRLDLYVLQSFGIDQTLKNTNIKPIAILSDTKMQLIPDVKTAIEQGYELTVYADWFLFGNNIDDKTLNYIRNILQTNEMMRVLQDLGAIPLRVNPIKLWNEKLNAAKLG